MDRDGIGTVGRRDAFQLPALHASVAKARQRAVERLREWGVDGKTRDSAELVISELVTNAVCHTDSEKIGCDLRIVVGARLLVEVTDEGSARALPHPGSGDLDGEGGRGLLLVDALSEMWGVRPRRSGQGYVVWAELRYHPAPAGSGSRRGACDRPATPPQPPAL